jgi:hypothetical protein
VIRFGGLIVSERYGVVNVQRAGRYLSWFGRLTNILTKKPSAAIILNCWI